MIIKFLFLLFLGGFIVLTSFILALYLGPVSIANWRLINSLHFIGGIYAFFFIRFIFYHTHKYHKTETAFLTKIAIFVGGALILGVLWEWYEFIFVYRYGALGLYPKDVTLYYDTMVDLMLDLLGAISAGIYLIVKNGKNK